MSTPLSERMRPKTLDDYLGQVHIIGDDTVLQRSIKNGAIGSMIFWGPPGVGKTTLARIIANHLNRPFKEISAINSGVKEVREVINSAKEHNLFSRNNQILFIDEIHRFSKSQQDSLLGAVEKGLITLIGATTENPSFEVIPALLSRCSIYKLEHLDVKSLNAILYRAINNDEILEGMKIDLQETDALIRLSGGDARRLLNGLEVVVNYLQTENKEIIITNEVVGQILQENPSIYDKGGEMHYDVISAFIKSVRGSHPDAAVYYLARMLEGGEDVKFIARRLIILAAEDIGLANPNALLMANQCMEACHKIGMPEARIILSQCTIYLACSAKSNSAYLAIDKALDYVRKNINHPVPLHLRNAPTQLMKELNYGKEYKYPHDFPHHFVDQLYLPEEVQNARFYSPANNHIENKFKEILIQLFGNKY